LGTLLPFLGKRIGFFGEKFFYSLFLEDIHYSKRFIIIDGYVVYMDLALQLLKLKISQRCIDLNFQGMDMERGRILNRESFLNLLKFEVRRARRYQNFFCILLLKLSRVSGYEKGDGNSLQSCCQTLTKLLLEDLRDSDILGSLENNQMAILFPYADLSAIGPFRARLESNLKYYEFEVKGYEVTMDLLCFPVDGTDTADLIGKLKEQMKPSWS
jgi:GGDEF domain-containing protein